MVVAAIQARLKEQKPMYSSAVAREDSGLYRAARRHLKTWKEAMRAAGLDPADYQRGSHGRIIVTDAGPRERLPPSQGNVSDRSG